MSKKYPASHFALKLCADPNRLRQILTNLVANAFTLTDCGTVSVRVSRQTEDEYRVTIRFAVLDTGIGISKDALAISNQLVELMGGTIDVSNEPGHGSTFTFSVALTRHANQETVGQSQATSIDLKTPRVLIVDDYRTNPQVTNSRMISRGSGPKPLIAQHSLNEIKASHNRLILLVEDNEVNQTVALAQLSKLGYRVDTATNGQEALDALAHRSYDAVLMDCHMPLMDGFTATSEIRKREGDSKHTPIIAMTALAMDGDQEKCLASGMDAYLAKPVKRKRLAELLAGLFANDDLSASPAAEEVTTPIANDTLPVDVGCLTDAASDNPPKLKHIIDLYVHHTAARLDELKIAIERNATGDVRDIAHKCLGSSRTCGMTAIVPSLRELERLGKEADLLGAEDQLHAAQVAFEKIKKFLDELTTDPRSVVYV